MPLMHQGLNQRLTALNEKCKLDILSMADYGNIENFSLRDYFKIELFFKLFFFLILFGIHMKGYNIPIFISLLVVYYWYYLYMDINAFYDKKIGEINLTKEEIREVKNDFKSEEEAKNEEEILANNEKNLAENIPATNSIESNVKNEENMTSFNKQNISNENKLVNENDINYDLNYVKENDIIVQNEDLGYNSITNLNEEKYENLESRKKKEILPEMEGISNMMKKYEKEKRKGSGDQTQEGFIK
jgi:hypothetical protein